MSDLLPLFLNLTGRAVLLVGGGRVATAKLQQLLAAGARVRVVAPALTALLREAFDALLPRDLARWVLRARAERVVWRREGVPMEARKPRLLAALNDLYRSPEGARQTGTDVDVAQGVSPAVPWLNLPEDSWL